MGGGPGAAVRVCPLPASVDQAGRTVWGCGAPYPSLGFRGDIAARPLRGSRRHPHTSSSAGALFLFASLGEGANPFPSCPAMGAAVFFGCTFVAFGPAFALFLITVAGDPLRVIILVAG